MNKDVMTTTVQIISEYEAEQQAIHEDLQQVEALLEKLEERTKSQKARFQSALHVLSDNERYYRDALHLTELTDNLSVADELAIFRQLKEATAVRRIGKDMLQKVGLDPQSIMKIYAGTCSKIAHTKVNEVPVARFTERTASAVGHMKKTLTDLKNNKGFDVSLQEVADTRYYCARSPEGSPQLETIKHTLNNIRFHDKKLKGYVLQRVPNGGNKEMRPNEETTLQHGRSYQTSKKA